MRRLALFGVVVLLMVVTMRAQSNTLSRNDHTEIHELFARYAHAMDSSNQDALLGVFTEDGVFTIDGVRTWNGRTEIASLLAAPPRERPKVTHFFSNILVEPTADGAKASHYVILIDLQKDSAVTGGGYCDHTLVRTEEGWRMKTRVCYVEPGPTQTTE